MRPLVAALTFLALTAPCSADEHGLLPGVKPYEYPPYSGERHHPIEREPTPPRHEYYEHHREYGHHHDFGFGFGFNLGPFGGYGYGGHVNPYYGYAPRYTYAPNFAGFGSCYGLLLAAQNSGDPYAWNLFNACMGSR